CSRRSSRPSSAVSRPTAARRYPPSISSLQVSTHTPLPHGGERSSAGRPSQAGSPLQVHRDTRPITRSVRVREGVPDRPAERHRPSAGELWRALEPPVELVEEALVPDPLRLVQARTGRFLERTHPAPETCGHLSPATPGGNRCQAGKSVRTLQVVVRLTPDLQAFAVEAGGLYAVFALECNIAEAVEPSGQPPDGESQRSIGSLAGEPPKGGAQIVVVTFQPVEKRGRLRAADRILDGAGKVEVVLGVPAPELVELSALRQQ